MQYDGKTIVSTKKQRKAKIKTKYRKKKTNMQFVSSDYLIVSEKLLIKHVWIRNEA